MEFVVRTAVRRDGVTHCRFAASSSSFCRCLSMRWLHRASGSPPPPGPAALLISPRPFHWSNPNLAVGAVALSPKLASTAASSEESAQTHRARRSASYRGGFANEHAHPSVGGWSEGATRPRDAPTVRRRPPRVAVPTPRQVTSSRCRHESARRNQPERGSDAPLQPPGPRHAHPRRRAEHRTRRERCRGCRHSCARTVVGGDHAATQHKGVRGLHDAGKRERRRAAGPRRSRRRVDRVVARAIRDPVARARQARMATQRRGGTVRHSCPSQQDGVAGRESVRHRRGQIRRGRLPSARTTSGSARSRLQGHDRADEEHTTELVHRGPDRR